MNFHQSLGPHMTATQEQTAVEQSSDVAAKALIVAGPLDASETSKRMHQELHRHTRPRRTNAIESFIPGQVPSPHPGQRERRRRYGQA